MEYIGIYFGLYVLVTIGLYHILVVKLEAWFGVWPWIAFLLLGLACLYFSIVAKTAIWSMWWGYNAFLNLWSVKEMFDQRKRVRQI
jgi:hypothetical protein